MTRSEKFVADLCNLSFLPFWSFPSPVGKKGNELCDLLVVCHNYIIIFSVKDISLTVHEDEDVVYERWVKKAVEASVSQIYGAEKFLQKVDSISSHNNEFTINLPPKEDRIIFRIAVAFGSDPKFPLPTGHFGEGYVHVFDEKSTPIILKELDTIVDFTKYLAAKQDFCEKNLIIVPFEKDFLAFYLMTGLDIKEKNTVLVGEDDMWEDYITSSEYEDWKNEMEVSYCWDMMIQSMFFNHVKPETNQKKRNDLETALRIISLEPRINRLELATVLENAIKSGVKARMIPPFETNDYMYVFMPLSSKNWATKEAELGLRCIIARAEYPKAKRVIGIGMGKDENGEIVFDVHYINLPDVDDEFIRKANKMKAELGYFKNPKLTHSKEMRKKQ